MATCKHTQTVDGTDYGYTGSVAVHPYTDENRAAHGCITFSQTCRVCGAERAVNANQGHREYSPWGPSAAERERAERRAAYEARRASEDHEDALIRQHQVRILRTGQYVVQVSVDGRAVWAERNEIEAAADQSGDLGAFYRGLRRAIADHESGRA